MAHIYLDFDAYRHNLNYLSTFCKGIERLIVVFKDNAYGHGLAQMAPLAAAAGVTKAAVRNCDEARQIDGLFDEILILADYPTTNSSSSWFFAAHSIEALHIFPEKTNIHLTLDTGMHRNGISLKEVEEAFKIVKAKNLNLEACFTHYYCADELSADFFVQVAEFRKFKKNITKEAKSHSLKTPLFHSCNSAALLRQGKNSFEDDYARVGIATYGYVDLPEIFGKHDLRPVLSLWAKRISSRRLSPGDRLGYGGLFEVKDHMQVSTYDLGYGDGLLRYGGLGKLCLANKKPLLGKVSMDSFIIEGADDEVCVFQDAREFASFFGTIPYDILVKLSSLIPRSVLRN